MAVRKEHMDTFVKRYPHEDDAEHDRKIHAAEETLSSIGFQGFVVTEFSSGSMIESFTEHTVLDEETEG